MDFGCSLTSTFAADDAGEAFEESFNQVRLRTPGWMPLASRDHFSPDRLSPRAHRHRQCDSPPYPEDTYRAAVQFCPDQSVACCQEARDRWTTSVRAVYFGIGRSGLNQVLQDIMCPTARVARSSKALNHPEAWEKEGSSRTNAAILLPAT